MCQILFATTLFIRCGRIFLRKFLVVKYKRVEESGLGTMMQKLNWHSVVKKSSRFNQRITQFTGLVSQVSKHQRRHRGITYLMSLPLVSDESRRRGNTFWRHFRWSAVKVYTAEIRIWRHFGWSAVKVDAAEMVVTKPDTSKSGIREETGPNLVRALGMFSDSHTRTRINFELFAAQ